jgi:L-rhamnose mutarotase
MARQRHCFALDLKNDPELVAEYERYHQQVWPGILESIRDAGIELLEIYRVEQRLFMIMEVSESFSFERKQSMDDANALVQEWEALMWKYQQALPSAAPGQKWMPMKKIFQL